MSENLKKFFEFVGNNPEILEKAKQLKADDPEAAKGIVIAFAKEHGFELTEEDFSPCEGELSESELASVAGGGTCACVVGGGGTADEPSSPGQDSVCWCVGGGFGEDIWGDRRCTCVFGGGGKSID